MFDTDTFTSPEQTTPQFPKYGNLLTSTAPLIPFIIHFLSSCKWPAYCFHIFAAALTIPFTYTSSKVDLIKIINIHKDCFVSPFNLLTKSVRLTHKNYKLTSLKHTNVSCCNVFDDDRRIVTRMTFVTRVTPLSSCTTLTRRCLCPLSLALSSVRSATGTQG